MSADWFVQKFNVKPLSQVAFILILLFIDDLVRNEEILFGIIFCLVIVFIAYFILCRIWALLNR